MDIKQEINNIRSIVDDISGLLDCTMIKVDNHYIKNPETDARIGICLDIILDNVNKIENKTTPKFIISDYGVRIE